MENLPLRPNRTPIDISSPASNVVRPARRLDDDLLPAEIPTAGRQSAHIELQGVES